MKRILAVAVALSLLLGCGARQAGKGSEARLRVIVDDDFGPSVATVQAALEYWEWVAGIRFNADIRDVRNDVVSWIDDDTIGIYYTWNPNSWQSLVWSSILEGEDDGRVLGFTLRATHDIFLRPSQVLFAVTVHEMGHALGCGHTDDENDIMFPYIRHGAFTVSAECVETIKHQHMIMLMRQNRKAAEK